MKRSSLFQYDEYLPLGIKPIRVWGYGKTGTTPVCRVEINGAGVVVYQVE